MSSASSPRRRHRAALIILVIAAAATCLALAWWQWDRYDSASGSAQNLGYAMQWPAFAVAVIYAYRRFVVLEDKAETDDEPDSRPMTEIPAGILPDRETLPSAESLAATPDPTTDAGLIEYNRYLAELDQADRRSTPSTSNQ